MSTEKLWRTAGSPDTLCILSHPCPGQNRRPSFRRPSGFRQQPRPLHDPVRRANSGSMAKDSKDEPGKITPRSVNYADWYQDVIREGQLAEVAGVVKGCMVIKPNGYAIWE